MSAYYDGVGLQAECVGGPRCGEWHRVQGTRLVFPRLRDLSAALEPPQAFPAALQDDLPTTEYVLMRRPDGGLFYRWAGDT